MSQSGPGYDQVSPNGVSGNLAAFETCKAKEGAQHNQNMLMKVCLSISKYFKGYALGRRPLQLHADLGGVLPPFWHLGGEPGGPFWHIGSTLEDHGRSRTGTGRILQVTFCNVGTPEPLALKTEISISFGLASRPFFVSLGRPSLLKPGFRMESIAKNNAPPFFCLWVWGSNCIGFRKPSELFF